MFVCLFVRMLHICDPVTLRHFEIKILEGKMNGIQTRKIPHSPGRRPEIQIGGAWGNWVNDDGAIGSAWPGRAWLWLSAWLGSVTLGRQRRSLEGDLDISTHRLEISGKVARPVFFLRKVARRRERGRTDGRTHRIFCPIYPAHCAG